MNGLTPDEVRQRLQQYGPNEIHRERATPAWRVFLGQFEGALVWLLLGACVLCGLLGQVGDAVAIASILLLNATVGFLQEFRAERAVLALRSMTAPRARVQRSGGSALIPASEVVPGDLLVLDAGDVVAADAHLLEAHQLTTVEAALTGESAPVRKALAAPPAGAPLAERHDQVFMGTAVANGTGLAEVRATGMQTQLGQIATLMAGAEEDAPPLKKQLEGVGRSLLVICCGIVVVVAAAELVQGMPWLDVLLSSVSLAVAAVPEGLATLVTLALAVGVQRMARRHVLVRHLAAIEALGATTVICTDKTGTLTQGAMAVRALWGPDEQALLVALAACCDAELGAAGAPATGDPTEVALLVAAQAKGVLRADVERDRPRVEVNAFSSERKRMSVLRADGVLYVKGAPEVIFARCTAGAEGAPAEATALAEKGMRVLAVATGATREESGLTLLGLVGLADPPRPEAVVAIAQARAAGIRTVMITGDHPATAQAIAREMGLLQPGDDPAVWVHARATAEDKLKIVRDWKRQGAVVAMTGDGVNDAPALREAHVGIAMGKTGTEVTREASDLLLSDDNFASIVAAVQEGRGIFENIQKALVYLLAGNCGELIVMLGAALVGMPLPLLPLQLLWVNLVTDGLPALALVMDPASPALLLRPPRPPAQPILDRGRWLRIVGVGVVQAAVTLGVFTWALHARDLGEARDLAFTTLVFGEVLRAFPARSTTQVFWEVGALTNLFLVGIGAASVLLQVGIHQLGFTQRLFALTSLSWQDGALCLALGLVPATLQELLKLAIRAFRALRAIQAAKGV